MTELDALIEWYGNLSPERVGEVGRFYHEEARFTDPFNDVTGLEAIEGIFRHMFQTTDEARFRVSDAQTEGRTAWVSWTFDCRLRRVEASIEGVTRLDFGDDGRVIGHRDFWDSADLFAEFPLLGTMVRHLRKRVRAPQKPQVERAW